MIKLILCLCLLILGCSRSLSQAPPWQWAKDANSPGPEQAWDVACYKATGDVYVAGSFNGNLSAFYGSGLSSASGAMDGFVAKYSSAGSVLWAFKISGPDAEEVKSVAVDPYGNVYITGDFKNTVDFDPSAATYTLSTFGGPANPSGFLAKYTSSGALLWAVRLGNTQPSGGFRVFADSNAVYLTGNYTASATFYSTNAVTKTTAAGQQQLNMFSAKYDPAGVVQWVVSAGSVKDDVGYNIIADHSNVYMIGTNQHDMSVYDASGSQVATVQINGPNKTDVYILAYQQSGAFLWAANVGSNDDDFGSGLTQDAGNLYISGSIKNTASFPYPSPIFTKACQGGMDIFLAKLSKSSGTFQWVSSQTGSGNNNEVGYELDMGLNNTIVMSGYFDNSLNYTSYGGSTLSTSGNEDIFVTSFDNAGNFNWAVKAGANGKDEPYGLSTDTAGSIFVAGEHAQNTVFSPYVITSGAGTNIFVAKMGCNPVSNNTATASQTICTGNAPSSLNGSTPLGGNSPYVYTWQQSSNGTSWSDATGTYTNQNYAPPPLSSATYYRRIAASANGCGSSSTSSSLLISIDAQPTPASAGIDQTICATSSTLSANTPVTGSGSWSLLSGSGTVVSNSSPGSAVNALGQGNNKFIWTISNGVCPASKDTVTILRYAVPTAANAGTNQTLCAGTATLSANNPAIGSGSWNVISGTGTVTAVSSPSSTVGSLSTGTNTLVWTISNGVCPASKDTVIITRDALPTPANAGSDQVLCSTGSTLTANAASTGSGLWTVIAGTGTVTATASPTTTIGNLNTGINKFVWTISNGVCPASKDTVKITRDAVPTTANAGANQILCAGTATLSANNPSTGSGSWNVISGTGTVMAVSSPSSTVGSLSTGTNTLVWTISNGVCPASKDTVVITRDALPTPANAGSDQVLCSGTATFSANTPATGTGTWSVLAGAGSVSAPNSPNSAANGLSTGINQFIWTVSNGTCPTSKDTVKITRDALPTTANAGSDQTLCSSTTTFSANAPSTGTAAWSVLSGAGSVSATGSPTSAVNGLSTGINQFIWTISNGTCPASKDTVKITRDALPTPANAGSDQVLCTAGSTLNGNTATIGTGLWSVIAGTGTVTAASSPTTSIGNLNTGTNKFIWTISNGTCPASRDTVTVTRDAAPSVANAGPSQTLCAQSCNLSANSPAVGSASWSVLSGGGIIANSSFPASAVNNLSPGINTFIWTVSNGSCPDSKDTVVITRDVPPTPASAGADQTICGAGTTLNANAPSTGIGSWALIAGSGSATSPTSHNSPATGLAPGINLFTWTISNGSCLPSSDTVIILSSAFPSTANAGPNQAVCAPNGSLTANIPTVGTGTWSVIGGTALLNNPLLAATNILGLSAGNNVFVWMIGNGVCPVSSDTVLIRRDLQPTIAVAGNDQAICASGTTLDGNMPVTGNGSWTLVSGSGSLVNSSSPAAQVTGLAAGNAVFAWTISNGVCPASQDTVTIHVDASPGTANAGNDQAVCSNAAVLSAAPPPAGSGSWSLLSGAGTLSNLNAANSGVNGLPVGISIFRWTVSNGVCPSSYDDISVKRDTMPSQAQAGPDQDLEIPSGHMAALAPTVGSGSWSLVSGDGALDNTSDPAASFHDLAVGSNIFRWTVSNGACPASADEVNVYLEPFKIPNAFSPNGDNINDTFVVPGIDYYNGVKFTIFNRWGGTVYENDNYKNDWGGTNKSNELLAEDTYYYILDVGPKMSYTGYVIIKRNK